MLEKLRDGDYLYSYFLHPGGTTVWIIKRGDTVFLQMIVGNIKWASERWMVDSRHDYPGVLVKAFKMMGFTEFVVYREINRRARKHTYVKNLLEQFEIFENAQRQAREEADKDLAKQETESVS